MLRNLAISTVLCVGAVSVAHADVYRWVDDHGGVHYSDQWVPGSETIKSSPKPPGSGGSSMSTYTAITASNQTLWTTGVAQGPFQTITTDVKVQNINAYTDASGGGATNDTNTLTYSVITL